MMLRDFELFAYLAAREPRVGSTKGMVTKHLY